MSGLYIPELGHLAMILALCFAIVQAIVPLPGEPVILYAPGTWNGKASSER